MSFRSAHHHPALRAAFVLVVCLVLTGSIPVLPSFEEDETPAMVFRAPSWPIHALAENSSVRIEKQGQVQRFSLHKPHRHSAPLSIEHASAVQQRPQLSHRPTRTFPRRFLPVRHFVPRGPDDSTDPLLS
jgi:hypothetical protein